MPACSAAEAAAASPSASFARGAAARTGAAATSSCRRVTGRLLGITKALVSLTPRSKSGQGPTLGGSYARLVGVILRILGIGALVAGGIAVALAALAAVLLLGPLVFWLAWNVLNFGPALGLPELGFWGIVLATLFLVVGWFPKVVITAIVFLVDPSWFHGSARVHWPETTFRNFVAIALLALLASRPHAHAQGRKRRNTG